MFALHLPCFQNLPALLIFFHKRCTVNFMFCKHLKELHENYEYEKVQSLFMSCFIDQTMLKLKILRYLYSILVLYFSFHLQKKLERYIRGGGHRGAHIRYQLLFSSYQISFSVFWPFAISDII